MTSKRQVLGARVDNETISMLRKMAKKKYGKETKIGYVVDEAVKVYFTNSSRPEEAKAILSTTEEILIDRLDRRMGNIFDSVIDRLGDLYARTSHDSAVSFVMLEDIFIKSGLGSKNDVAKLRGNASRIMQKRLETAGTNQQLEDYNQQFKEGMAAEESEKLKEQLQEVRNNSNKLLNEKDKQLEQQKKEIERLQQENGKWKQEVNNMNNWQSWYDSLIDYIRKNDSRFKKSTELIDEYEKQHPMPGA